MNASTYLARTLNHTCTTLYDPYNNVSDCAPGDYCIDLRFSNSQCIKLENRYHANITTYCQCTSNQCYDKILNPLDGSL